jgi:hypothetical protein
LKERRYSLRIAKENLSNGADDTTTHDLADMQVDGITKKKFIAMEYSVCL